MQYISLQSCAERGVSISANALFMVQIEADHQFIRALVDWAEGGVVNRVAAKIGAAASTINRHYNGTAGSKLSLDTLTKLQRAYPDFPGWMERNGPVTLSEVGARSPRPYEEKYGDQDLARIPVLGSAVAMNSFDPDQHIELTELHLSEVLDSVLRPQSLKDDKEAYAVTIVGDSMWPRFRPGRRVIVSPRAPVSIGDDVIVQVRGAEGDAEHRDRVAMVLIKELVKRSASWIELRQFNPDATFKVPTERIAAIHKVVGEVF